jgi:hypothetical protein
MTRSLFATKRIVWALSAFVFTIIRTSIPVVCAQSTQLEVVPTRNIGPINFAGLPLDPETHKAVEDAVKSRDYRADVEWQIFQKLKQESPQERPH